MFFKGARAGILDGLLATAEETGAAGTELARGFRDTLILKFAVGVFDRDGGGPRTVPPRWPAGAGLAGFGCDCGATEGAFDGGGADLEEAYSSSRYRSPWTKNGRPYSSSQVSKIGRAHV